MKTTKKAVRIVLNKENAAGLKGLDGYGHVQILWCANVGITLMFGSGNAFDSVVSWAAYRFWLKKNHIRITDVD